MTERPINCMKKWSKQEETDMLNRIQDNEKIDIIADTFGRTINGIKARLRKISYELYCNDIEICDIIKKTGLSKKEVEDSINRRKNYENKNVNKINYEIVYILDKLTEKCDKILKILDNIEFE